MIHASSACTGESSITQLCRSGCVATIQAGRRPSHLAPTEPTAGRERILAILRVQHRQHLVERFAEAAAAAHNVATVYF